MKDQKYFKLPMKISRFGAQTKTYDIQNKRFKIRNNKKFQDKSGDILQAFVFQYMYERIDT